MIRKPTSSPSAAGTARWVAAALAAALLTLPGPRSGDAQPRPPLRPVVDGCPVCELWAANEEILLQTRQEIGRLPDGVIYLYSSDRPSVIEPLIRFAYQRAELDRTIQEDPDLRARLGGACGHNLTTIDPDYRTVISTSAHGFFAVLTSPRRTTVKLLHQDAQRSVRLGVPVRF